MLQILHIFSIFIALNNYVGNNIFISNSPETNVNHSQADMVVKPFVDGDSYFMKEVDKYYVYLHKTLSGKPFYIGKGIGKRAWSKKGRNIFWKRIVKKSGGFTYEYLATRLTEEQAFELEEYYITLYGRRTIKNGCLVNIEGGGQKPNSRKTSIIVYQFTKEGKYIEKYPSISSAAEQLGFGGGDECIRQVLDKPNRSTHGFMFTTTPNAPLSYKRKHWAAKKVYAYSLDGKYLAEYESITDCARKLNIDYSGVQLCCTREITYSKGYIFSHFKFEDGIKMRQKPKPRHFKIKIEVTKTETGEVEVFESMYATHLVLGIHLFNLQRCIKENKEWKGLKFKKLNKYKDELKL